MLQISERQLGTVVRARVIALKTTIEDFVGEHAIELVVHSPLSRAAVAAFTLFSSHSKLLLQNDDLFEKSRAKHLKLNDMKNRADYFKLRSRRDQSKKSWCWGTVRSSGRF